MAVKLIIDRIPPDMHIDENGNITWTPRLIDYNAANYSRGHVVTADEFNTELIKQTYQGNYNTDTITILTKLYNDVNTNSRTALEKVLSVEALAEQASQDASSALSQITQVAADAKESMSIAQQAANSVADKASTDYVNNALTEYYTKPEVDSLLKNIDLTEYYTKAEVNTLIENVEVDLTDYYTKTEVDTSVASAVAIADSKTTITIRSWDEW